MKRLPKNENAFNLWAWAFAIIYLFYFIPLIYNLNFIFYLFYIKINHLFYFAYPHQIQLHARKENQFQKSAILSWLMIGITYPYPIG